jgi:hypothetical protein
MFCQDDFLNKEIKEKIQVITMSKMGKYPLTDFETLTMKEKRVANEIVNEYIKKLPTLNKDWNTKLTTDFNLVCNEEIFNHPKIDYTNALFKQKPIEDFDPIIETDKLSILK